MDAESTWELVSRALDLLVVGVAQRHFLTLSRRCFALTDGR
jgi:hypothetical protein